MNLPNDSQESQPPQQVEPAVAGEAQTPSSGIIEVSHTRISPLPPPEELKLYEEVEPGAAHRILAMAETEQRQQHHLQNETVTSHRMVINRDFALSILGMVLAFALVMTCIWQGIALIERGNVTIGITISLGPLVGLVLAFFLGIRDRRKVKRDQVA